MWHGGQYLGFDPDLLSTSRSSVPIHRHQGPYYNQPGTQGICCDVEGILCDFFHFLSTLPAALLAKKIRDSHITKQCLRGCWVAWWKFNHSALLDPASWIHVSTMRCRAFGANVKARHWHGRHVPQLPVLELPLCACTGCSKCLQLFGFC